MTKIIFLNGCGSSGKTSLAKALQQESKDLWLTFGVDTFIEMMPVGKQEAYLKFIPGQNERGPTMQVDSQPEGSKLFSVIPKLAEMLALQGHNLIIDEVLLEESALEAYVQTLKEQTVYYIGVFCDLQVMQEREILRRDRWLGLSNDQLERVHQGKLESYDFKVNTTTLSPFEAARLILKFIQETPVPKAFASMR